MYICAYIHICKKYKLRFIYSYYFYVFHIENIHQNEVHQSESSSSGSTYSVNTSTCSTSLPGRKITETIKSEISSLEQNKFWTIVSNVIESVAKNEEMEDSLRHWILYLKNKLRKIKNSKKLKKLQRNIIAIVDNADSD